MSRIVLKVSGEALKENEKLVDTKKLEMLKCLVQMLLKNHEVAIVIGGGNFFRGREHLDMEALDRDTIGLLGTIMNAIYVSDYFKKSNIKNIVKTPFSFPGLIEEYEENEVAEYYNKGYVVIFGGGIGKSGYSTDSGTALAGFMLDADLIIKLTNVDGVYDSDPRVNKEAHKFSFLTYQDVINNNYQVMDLYAIKKCQEKGIKILVLNFNDYTHIEDYFKGKNIGTLIGDGK